MDTDFLPNKAGTFFNFSGKSRAEEQEEQAIREARDVLKQIVERLDDRIAHYKSVDAIPDSIVADKELLSHNMAANKLTAANLEQEREVIQALIDQ